MSAAGSALMAIGEASGDTRAVEAAQIAIASPLLDIDISGARGVLFNITGGLDLTLYEVNEAADIISKAAHPEANIIFGAVQEAAFDGTVKITVIATGFDGQGRGRVPSLSQNQGRMEYNRSMFYPPSQVPVAAGSSNAPLRQPQASMPQGYAAMPVTPPPVNISHVSNHPTGPLRPTPQAQPAGRQRASMQDSHRIPGQPVAQEDVFDLDTGADDFAVIADSQGRLPAPEPEAQPAQRPAAPGEQRPQRPIRRPDPKVLDLPRGNRNAPPGDSIDVPAFLRRR